MRCCPTCGQTLPEPEPANGVHLSPTEKRILARVSRAGQHGVLSDDLFDHIYLHRADGGPLTGKSCLRALIWNLNRRLKPAGKRITAPAAGSAVGRRGGSIPRNYKLVAL